MLWEISSGDLKAVIESSREELEKSIISAIETHNPESLGLIIKARRLTGWTDSTTIDELEGEDTYRSTEYLLKKMGKWAD